MRRPPNQVKALHTANDARELQKVTMPIQELDDKETQHTKQFEPIILEEVYFNEQEIETLRVNETIALTQVDTLSNADRTPRNKSSNLSHL